MMYPILAAILCVILAMIMGLLLVMQGRALRNRFLKLAERMDAFEKMIDRSDKGFKEELSINRRESSVVAKQGREELSTAFKTFSDTLFKQMRDVEQSQKNQLDIFSNNLKQLTQENEQRLERMRGTVEERLLGLQNDNNQHLEKMRLTVDEKLHETLKTRLGESFKIVSERLEQVHKGLGEMQNLASGVGDLKRVLTNIKTRGTWGEIQLDALLEQILTQDQYAKNVVTKKKSQDRVEFAIKLPGRDEKSDEPVWLPIDAKFPQEDYQRMLDAHDRNDAEQVELAYRQLELRIKLEAKNIKAKYVDPPHTTDFAILFLPTEGLYAECLRRAGLFDQIQREHNVILTGPTTITAIINSLQLGFRTLAIEKRSSEVWTVLGMVKTEFGKFGGILDKTYKKLQEASHTIEDAARKSRTIERKLKNVQEMPMGSTEILIDEQ